MTMSVTVLLLQNKRSSIAQLLFDTPGSSVMRAVSFDMDINYAQNQVDLNFASPWWKTGVKGQYTITWSL
jgi:hypothetical protein